MQVFSFPLPLAYFELEFCEAPLQSFALPPPAPRRGILIDQPLKMCADETG